MNASVKPRRVEPFAIASFLLPLFVYLLTLAPSVTFFDSGEFITAVASLGVAHSPGYPLFVNYAKPFTFLPFGSIAFRVNFATAVSAGLACYGVYLLTMKFIADRELPWPDERARLARRLIALAAALTFACTPRLWLQSNHDKPYPLLAFICAVVFYLMLLWRESYDAGREKPGYVYLGAFLCGLGTGAHQIMVLMIPVYAWLLISKDWRVALRVKEFLIALSFGLLGFAIQLHIIVRALRMPLLNWGDSKNLTQFLWNMLRKGYPTVPPVRDLALFWDQVNAFSVPHEFTPVGMVLLVVGLASLALAKRDLVIAYLIGIASFLSVIVGYFNTPRELIFLTEEFFTPLYLLSAVFIGVGLFAVARELSGRLAGSKGAPAAYLLVGLFFVLPGAIALMNYRENDQHENYIAFDYASNTLKSLPRNAVMYTWGDSGAFPLWYVQGVERMREDLALPHTPHLVFDWYLDSMPALFKTSRIRNLTPEQLSAENALFVSIYEQGQRRPVYIDFSTRYSVQFSDFNLHQRGITYRLDPPGVPPGPPDVEVWNYYAMRGILDGTDMFFRDLDTGKAILIYSSAHIESGESLLKMNMREAGVRELETGLRISPEFAPQVESVKAAYGVAP